MDTKVIKKKRKNVYKKYLVKWEGYLEEEVIWMDGADMKKHRTSLEELISRGLEIKSLGEYGVGEIPIHNK